MPPALTGVVVAVRCDRPTAWPAARLLAAEGATVVLAGEKAEAAGATLADIEADRVGRAAYVAGHDGALIEEFAREQFGRLDVVLDDPAGDERDVARVRAAATRQ